VVSRRAALTAVCITALLLLALRARPSRADEPSSRETPPTEERLRQAKELFRQGNVLRESGDYVRALDFYRRSRALVESVPNTLNAALCLARLGRYDEAFELYDELLSRFSGELGDADRKSILSASESVLRRLGKLDVSANVDGALIIDGRPRGKLPLPGPVPVLQGEHLVRVMKDGYQTFEAKVVVRAGDAKALDAKLEPLVAWGKLRVDDTGLVGADLFVDGGLVGKLPWEGTLTPGAHVYVVRRGDVGSAPARAIVVQSQTVLVGVDPKPLGPEMDIAIEPPTADLFLGAVPLGHGGWHGRLPIGRHRIEAREAGYQSAVTTVTVTPESAGDVVVRLHVDPEHPRWGSRRGGHLWMEASAGPAIAATIAPGAADDCDSSTCERGAALGAFTALRAGYELPIGLSTELRLGMVAVHEPLIRTVDSHFGRFGRSAEVAYRYVDDVRMAGPFASAGIGYRRRLAHLFSLGGSVHLGAAFATTRDWVTADATTRGRTAVAEVEGSGAAVTSAAFFVMPEAEARIGSERVQMGIGLGAALFLLNGPTYPLGETRVRGGSCDRTAAALAVECAPGVRHLAGGRAYGPFALWVPSVGVRHVF
jgi:hypothetical protein